MNAITVYEVYINGKYQGWYETKAQAENFVKSNENASYKLAVRYWG